MKEKNKKRKILNFQLTSIDLQETEEIFEECETAFKDVFYDPRVEEQIQEQENRNTESEPEEKKEIETSNSTEIAESEYQHEEEDIAEVEEDIEAKSKEVVKKLFKAIALETHPDKLIGEEEDEVFRKTELYKKAAHAAKKNREHELLEIAMSLGITQILDDIEVFLLLDKAMKVMKEKISQMRNSMYWAWFHAPESQRNMIETQIEKQIGLKKRK